LQFSTIIGNDSLKNQLAQTIEKGLLSHAILLYGPEGNQALPMALAIATYLNCENRGETDSCGECNSCRKMNSLIHPDVHFTFPTISKTGVALSDNYIQEFRECLLADPNISYVNWMRSIAKDDKQGNISVHDMNNIIRKLSLKAYEAKHKVMIIWKADLIGGMSNKLLKIIEEPPQNTNFIVLANDLESILGTIKSRTQLLRVNPLTEAEIVSYLKKNSELDETAIRQVAAVSEGNINKARQMSSEVQNDFADLNLRWFRTCWKNDPNEATELIDEFRKMGKETQKNLIAYQLELFRSALQHKYKAKEVEKGNAESDLITFLADKTDLDQISALVSLYEKQLYYISRNANMKIQYFYTFITTGDVLKNNFAPAVGLD